MNPSLRDAYQQLLNYYKFNNTLPSLCFVDDQLRDLYIRYLKTFNESIAHIQENVMLKEEERICLNWELLKRNNDHTNTVASA